MFSSMLYSKRPFMVFKQYYKQDRFVLIFCNFHILFSCMQYMKNFYSLQVQITLVDDISVTHTHTHTHTHLS